ncbi:MAG: hypothetical protein AAFS07_18965 [Pseudomonadota bacterium]
MDNIHLWHAGMDVAWYFDVNPEHDGALRLVIQDMGTIVGMDPDTDLWAVRYVHVPGGIRVDFRSKPNHRGRVVLGARVASDPDRLVWEDGNVWYRCGVSPVRLIRGLLRRRHQLHHDARHEDRHGHEAGNLGYGRERVGDHVVP